MMPFIECDTSLVFLSTYQDSSSKLHDYLFLICVKKNFPSDHVLFPLLLINPIICILSSVLPFSLFPLKVFLSALLLKSFHFFIISAAFLNRVNSNWISKNTLAVFTRVLSWFSSFAITWDCPLIWGDSLFLLPSPNHTYSVSRYCMAKQQLQHATPPEDAFFDFYISSHFFCCCLPFTLFPIRFLMFSAFWCISVVFLILESGIVF